MFGLTFLAMAVHGIKEYLIYREKEEHKRIVRALLWREPTEEDLDWGLHGGTLYSSVDPADHIRELGSPVDDQPTVWRAWRQYIEPIFERRNRFDLYDHPIAGNVLWPTMPDDPRTQENYDMNDRSINDPWENAYAVEVVDNAL